MSVKNKNRGGNQNGETTEEPDLDTDPQGRDENGQNSNDEGSDDGDQSGDDDQFTGLLSDEDADDDDDNQSGGQGGNGESQYVTAKDVESALDRRINVVLKEIRKGPQRRRNDDDDDDDDQQGQQRRGGKSNRRQQQTPTGPSREDVREARSAYREFVADEIRFLGNEEREFARSAAESLITRSLKDDADPEDVGRDVAESVASDVRKMREFYEARTVAALRRKGVLPQKSGSQQQQQSGAGPVGATGSDWKKGQSKAQQMFADRYPKQG